MRWREDALSAARAPAGVNGSQSVNFCEAGGLTPSRGDAGASARREEGRSRYGAREMNPEREPTAGRGLVRISVVIPVYSGADTLADLVAEIAAYHEPQSTPDGRRYIVDEVALVWDRGPDLSDSVIRKLAATYDWVRPVWLSRNFGQHAATVAGMTATGGQWIVTMDEDGQHNPADIAKLLDTAYAERAQLVYAAPTNKAPHSVLRNVASHATKTVFLRLLSSGSEHRFHSFRLVAGEPGRSVAAYVGPGVYLDVALSWVVSDVASCPVTLRAEGRSASNYTTRRLFSHFWRLVISSGNRPLRLVSGLGVATTFLGLLFATYLVVLRLTGGTDVEGWTSAVVTTLLVGGVVMLSLGVIAEYVGVAAGMSMGKPMYVVVRDPEEAFEQAGADDAADG